MKFEELVRELEHGRIAPVYLISGEEYQLILMALEKIREALLTLHGGDLEIKRFDGSESNLLDVISEARTPSLFSSRKLIRVDEWHPLLSASSEKERESFIRYLSDPSPVSTILLLSPGKKGIGGRESSSGESGAGEPKRKSERGIRAIESALAKRGWIVDCPKQYSTIPSFIRSMAVEMRIKLTRDGEALVQEAAGNDLGLIRSELEKIALAVEPGGTADEETIRGLLSRSGDVSIFDYLNHLGNRRGAEALRSLEELCRNEPSDRHFIYSTMIFRFFQQLWMAKEMQAKGSSPAQISERLKINRFFVKERMEQSKRFTTAEIAWILRSLLETDLRIKTSPVTAEALLKDLTVSICGGRMIGSRGRMRISS